MHAGRTAFHMSKGIRNQMTVSQIGIIITLFLVFLAVVLIWDEIRAEQRFKAWLDDNEHKQKKARQ